MFDYGYVCTYEGTSEHISMECTLKFVIFFSGRLYVPFRSIQKKIVETICISYMEECVLRSFVSSFVRPRFWLRLNLTNEHSGILLNTPTHTHTLSSPFERKMVVQDAEGPIEKCDCEQVYD